MKKQKLTKISPLISNEYDLDDLLNQFSLQLRDHSRRVAICSALMVEHADPLLFDYNISSLARLTLIAHLGGTCHDLGIWMNPAQPGEQGYQKHPITGADLLQKHQNMLFDTESEAQMVMDMVRYHHERPDGSGFPGGLRTKNIPPAASICAIADWLDHRMEQRPAIEASELIKEVKEKTGSHFCESAVVCFEHALPQMMKQYAKWHRISKKV